MKVLWYTTCTGCCIGIVKNDEGKMHIGVASGVDENADISFINKTGDKFDLNMFEEYKLVITQYEKVVEQNRKLQEEIRRLNDGKN